MWDIHDSPEFDAFFWRVIDVSLAAIFTIALVAGLAGVMVRLWVH